jgi:hypothetical protein
LNEAALVPLPSKMRRKYRIFKASISETWALFDLAHTPLIRQASAAKTSESMAIFSNAAFDWKKCAIHNLYWVVAASVTFVDGVNVRDSRFHNHAPRWNAAPSA